MTHSVKQIRGFSKTLEMHDPLRHKWQWTPIRGYRLKLIFTSLLGCLTAQLTSSYQSNGKLGSWISFNTLESTDINDVSHLQRCPVFSFCTSFSTADASAPAGSAIMFFIKFSEPKEQGLITSEQQDTVAAMVLCSNHQRVGRSITNFWNGSVQTQELLCLFSTYFENWVNCFANSILGLALQIFTWGFGPPI